MLYIFLRPYEREKADKHNALSHMTSDPTTAIVGTTCSVRERSNGEFFPSYPPIPSPQHDAQSSMGMLSSVPHVASHAKRGCGFGACRFGACRRFGAKNSPPPPPPPGGVQQKACKKRRHRGIQVSSSVRRARRAERERAEKGAHETR